MSNMRNRTGRKPVMTITDESYDISECSSSRDPDAPHASDTSWYEEQEEYDFLPTEQQQQQQQHHHDPAKTATITTATLTKNARTVALLERLCSKKDATIADLLLKEREHKAAQKQKSLFLPREFENDCFISEMEDKMQRLEMKCTSKDQMIDRLRSSTNDLELMCNAYVEEIKALKASLSSSMETKKDREIILNLNKEIREQALEIHTLRSQMDYWKTTVLSDLEKRLDSKDQRITEMELERKTWMAESKVQEVITRPGGSPIQRERTEEDYLDEIRQLKATIDDLTKRLKSQTTKEPPSQLALNFYELEIELGKKQSELNAMDAELESTIHRLWMAEERNSELQNKLDQKMMIWNAFGESASSGYPYKEV